MKFDLKGCLECCANMDKLMEGNETGATEVFAKSFMPNIDYILEQTYFSENRDIVLKSEEIYEACQYIKTKLIEASNGQGIWLIQSMQITGYISILATHLTNLHNSFS